MSSHALHRIKAASPFIVTTAIALLFAFSGIILFQNLKASALNGNDFNPGRIIDDSVFYNNGSMSASQVQNFLNSKVPTCDTNGTMAASDWGRPDITHAKLAEYIRNGTNGYKRDTGFHAPPYTCLKDYRQNTPQMESASGLCGQLSAKQGQSAAQIIVDISNACSINPQVLLVLLEKEQSLITDAWPLQRALTSATGFDCPDTSPCDPAYAGPFYQLYYAARQFKVYQKYPNSYNYIAGRTNRIYWHPDLSRCGSSQVYIENQATAGLYNYTPYRPNQAALNNLYGTGDSCSSYGNRNFWVLFSNWFGSTRSFTASGAIGARWTNIGGGASKLGYPVSNEVTGLKNGGAVQWFEAGQMFWTSTTGAWEISGGIAKYWNAAGAENSPFGYPVSGELTNANGETYQDFQSGRIYWTPQHDSWGVLGFARQRWETIGGDTSILGVSTGLGWCGLKNNGCYQPFQNGKIYWSPTTNAWEVSGAIGTYWAQTLWEQGKYGYPTSAETPSSRGGSSQKFENGTIYWTSKTSAWGVSGGIATQWNSIGGVDSILGYPTSGERDGLKNGGMVQWFENGQIFWTPANGGWYVSGGIRGYWNSTGAENGQFGYPISNESINTNGETYQDFQNGRIYWTPQRGSYTI